MAGRVRRAAPVRQHLRAGVLSHRAGAPPDHGDHMEAPIPPRGRREAHQDPAAAETKGPACAGAAPPWRRGHAHRLRPSRRLSHRAAVRGLRQRAEPRVPGDMPGVRRIHGVCGHPLPAGRQGRPDGQHPGIDPAGGGLLRGRRLQRGVLPRYRSGLVRISDQPVQRAGGPVPRQGRRVPHQLLRVLRRRGGAASQHVPRPIHDDPAAEGADAQRPAARIHQRV